MNEDDVIIFSYVAFVFALICVLCPFRSCINWNLRDAQDFQQETVKDYKEVALSFPTDYDKSNPLTSKQGQIRMLDMQIEDARASGNEEAIKMFEGQKGFVGQ